MVLEAFNILVFVSRMVFGFLNLPSTPLLETMYGEMAYFIFLAITLASAHFIERKFGLALVLFTAAIAMVFGSLQLGMLTILIISPWFFFIRWFTGAPDYEEEVNVELPRTEKAFVPQPQEIRPVQQTPSHPAIQTSAPQQSLSEKFSFFKKEEAAQIYPTPNIRPICPNCAAPLKYIEQNKKFYCMNCQSYVSDEAHNSH